MSQSLTEKTNVENEDEVTIIEADTSLLRKFGKENLDRILSPEAVRRAENIIANASHDFYQDCVMETPKLKPFVAQLTKGGMASQLALKNIISIAFSVKTKSGQANYDLVAALAKSLHFICEETTPAQITPSMLKVIEWHYNSINLLLTAKMAGDGGEIGKDILAEIEKIRPKT